MKLVKTVPSKFGGGTEQAQYDLQTANLKAQANQVQDAALTDQILEQQAIAKWNGVMPTTVAGSSTLFGIPLGK